MSNTDEKATPHQEEMTMLEVNSEKLIEILRSGLTAKTEELRVVKADLEIAEARKSSVIQNLKQRAKSAEQSLSRAREETREVCARVCDGFSRRFENDMQSSGRDYAESCAKAIRALALPGHEKD